MVGIVSLGAYVPRLRLQRAAVVEAVAWFNAGLKALGKGERAMAGWDEDSITMALEAARDCLVGMDRGRVAKVVVASTSLPFADRQNAGVVKEALNLSDDVAAQDLTGSLRAGTSALLDALYAARGGAGDILCVASEQRRAKPASEAELINGDAAAAFLVGTDGLMVDFLGGHSVTVDFVDHFRASDRAYDYVWESRWVRDEGYGKIAPNAVKAALSKLGLTAADVDRFILAAPLRGVNTQVAKACGIAAEAVQDDLGARMGDAGCAQPLLLLAQALAVAKPGERIVLVGFGQGCDVLVFQATNTVAAASERLGVEGWLARRKPESSYIKHLFFGGALALDGGMRAEADQKTALTTLYRNRKAVLGLVGGRCTKTGTVQFPKSEISVAQNVRMIDTQEDYPLADRRARVVTYTADSLAYTPDPPGYYGTVEFEGGGRLLTEFTDVEADVVCVGQPMRMMFRIKAVDEQRGFKRYFWKAVPDYRARPSNTEGK
jgi:hydroxymethylglutaryl-CoA synthase